MKAGVAELFEAHRGLLWRIAYRLTGSSADADDIVQETFVRAMDRGPRDESRPWRPWLVKVALNVGRDLLRVRKRREYPGMWLPSPIESEPPSHEPVDVKGNPAARYDQLESISFAFLLALEALTPLQRAVLLLRDVFDYSVRETAEALTVSDANVKTTHLRARRAMAAYDASRFNQDNESKERNRNAFDRFLRLLAEGDVQAVELMLAADVTVISDSAGEFHSNYVPVVGREKVAKLFMALAQKLVPERIAQRFLNGYPSFVMERTPSPGFAPRWVLQIELDESGLIRRIYSVLASRKLAAVRPLQ